MTTSEPPDRTTAIIDWITRQRWFPGKGLDVRSTTIRHRLPLDDELAVLLVEFDYVTRPPETYQVPVISRPDPPRTDVETRGHIAAGPDGTHLYDAANHPAGSSRLLEFMSARRRTATVTGDSIDGVESTDPRPVLTEQSNTSVIFGELHIMKVIRQMWPGRNPDLELPLALDRANSAHSARTVAWLVAEVDGVEYTLATVQAYLADAEMGWPAVQRSLERVAGSGAPDDDFAHEAHLLGVATAEVHSVLAATFGTAPLGQDTEATVDTVRRRWKAVSGRSAELARFDDRVDDLTRDFATHGPEVRSQRIHNDLHLTQIMRTADAWVLIDFEGEPNMSIEQRERMVPAWRDVACMLRSFDYGAYYFLTATGPSENLADVVNRWLSATRSAFLRGYIEVRGEPTASEIAVLRLYELEKALFEIEYETTYRPTWLDIAVGATVRFLRGGATGPSV